MPSPRPSTVVPPDGIKTAVTEAKMGRVEYRLDRSGLMHVAVGKASFSEQQLLENLTVLADNIVRARPGGVKGEYIKSAFLTSTLVPSVRVDVDSMSALKIE